MKDRIFVDSNIFFYTVDRSDEEKQKKARRFFAE